ncbi:MAG TPA: NADP-dependent oxidoreductase [Gammaproteobacteria bacterium]|nr:NADP-dependent oxidoreductase [Gammaproteobacteria bacterium]
MSKAVMLHKYGPPEVLQLVQRTPPQPGPGQVRVRVQAAGVQPFDCAVRSGRFAKPGGAFRSTLPQMLGNEFSGAIDAVGSGVAGFKPGDPVLGWVMAAAYAQHVVVDASQIVRKPESVGWYPAAVISASGQAAHTALHALEVGPGDTLLIHAGAGGVGSFAVQLGQLWGARVIATASERNHDYLRSLGAIPVAYGPGLAQRVRAVAPQGVTAALDAAGSNALDTSVELVKDRRRIATLVDLDRAAALGVLAVRSQRSIERLNELVALHASGRLQVLISQAFPLERAADAHRLVETRKVRGKVVLTVD